MQAQTLTPEAQPCATVAGGKPRLDFYAGIHKALRLFLTRTLTRVGSTDPADAGELVRDRHTLAVPRGDSSRNSTPSSAS